VRASGGTALAADPVATRKAERRAWIRDTISTRAVGPIEVEPLPREELDALEMDCGGVGGEFLQQVRRTLNINLTDISARTKIGVGMLRAIEADELDRLPARVYLKGYLTQICRMLRLPTPQFPEKYLQRHGI
jgi:flagellar biosynthesis protein FlhG